MSTGESESPATDDAPCVLFITADQMQARCLSALGHPCVRTPHLDALAADGLLFTQHYAQCSPCGPARASLLTGLYLMNHRSGRNGTPLDARHTNLALEARRGGYDPVLFGYTDTSADPRGLAPEDPRLRGYEGVLPGMSVGVAMTEEVKPWRAYLKAKGYRVPPRPLDIYASVGTSRAADGSERPRPIYTAEHSDSAFITDKVLEYLSVHTGEPWFVHAVFPRPHPPLIAPEPYNVNVAREAVPSPRRHATAAREAEQHPYLAHLLERQRRPGYYMGHPFNIQEVDAGPLADLCAIYYGLIEEVDAQVGRLVEHLKATGDYARTLIVFTSDHGEMLGDHWLFGKEGYFDPAYHVPLIIRDPRPAANAARGSRIGSFTESVDLMPTILEWLSLDIPAACDGVSLSPFLEARPPPAWRTEAHWEYDFRDVADQTAEHALGLTSDRCALGVLRGERHKYVHFAGLPPLLFDLADDPGEFIDRAGDADYREILLDCAQRMLNWRMTHADRTLSNIFLGPDGPVSRTGLR